MVLVVWRPRSLASTCAAGRTSEASKVCQDPHLEQASVKRSLTPSIGELSAFEAAARNHSFALAAIELNLTQSAVSRLIRALEGKLAIRLFERVKQRAVLTELGKLYWHDVRPILASVDIASTRIRALREGATTLNISVLASFAVRWLIPALPEFLIANPKISINLAARVNPQELAVEPYDAAIHYGAPVWAGAFVHHLMDEELSPICSPTYRARLRLFAPGDLARAQLLQQLTRPNAWAFWFSEVGIENPNACLGHQFDHFAMSIQAARHHLGVALVPRFLVTEELARKELITLFEGHLRSEKSYFLEIGRA